jgi:SIR2-like domain
MATVALGPGVRQIVDAISEGRCLLFLGAGVHAPPPDGSRWVYPETTRPLLGAEFSACLAEELKDELDLAREFPNDVGNLQRSSLHFEMKRTRNQLIDQLTRAVQTDKAPSPALWALAELDFPLVITTNYDRLLEEAFSRAGKTWRLSVYNKQKNVKTVDYRDAPPLGPVSIADPRGLAAPDSQNPFVLKIHGDIVDRKSIVITDEDYIHFVMRTRDPRRYNPVPQTFQVAIETWTTLFIGYSLLDYNLRLLFKTLRWDADPANTPDSYSVDCRPDPLIAQVLGNPPRLVTFVVLDLWKFVPDLYRCLMGKEMPD